MKTNLNLESHPCFNAAVKGRFGRVHLPVAGKCNILCNYCNRKYDCVNESRPGVTSALLSRIADLTNTHSRRRSFPVSPPGPH